MTDRDTPRTEALIEESRGYMDRRECEPMIDFARQLERELANEREKFEFVVQQCREAQEIASEARRDQARYRGGYEAACVFIDSHVADPDITPRMCATYAAFEAQRAAIDAATAPAPTPPQS